MGSLFTGSSKVLFKAEFIEGNLEEPHKEVDTKASGAYCSKEDMLLGASKVLMATDRLEEVSVVKFR